MSEPEATDRPRPRVPWPTIVVVGLALFGAISLVQFILGLAFTLAKLLIVAGIVAVLVVFLKGPPD